jgi:hypothetical protein
MCSSGATANGHPGRRSPGGANHRHGGLRDAIKSAVSSEVVRARGPYLLVLFGVACCALL